LLTKTINDSGWWFITLISYSQSGRFAPKGAIRIIRHTTKPEFMLIKGNMRIEKYSGGKTKYRDAKTGKFTYKPKE
jgi:hypothetical protein